MFKKYTAIIVMAVVFSAQFNSCKSAVGGRVDPSDKDFFYFGFGSVCAQAWSKFAINPLCGTLGRGAFVNKASKVLSITCTGILCATFGAAVASDYHNKTPARTLYWLGGAASVPTGAIGTVAGAIVGGKLGGVVATQFGKKHIQKAVEVGGLIGLLPGAVGGTVFGAAFVGLADNMLKENVKAGKKAKRNSKKDL